MSRTASSLLRNLAKEPLPSVPPDRARPASSIQTRMDKYASVRQHTTPSLPHCTGPKEEFLVEDVRRRSNKPRYGSCDRAVKKGGRLHESSDPLSSPFGLENFPRTVRGTCEVDLSVAVRIREGGTWSAAHERHGAGLVMLAGDVFVVDVVVVESSCYEVRK